LAAEYPAPNGSADRPDRRDEDQAAAGVLLEQAGRHGLGRHERRRQVQLDDLAEGLARRRDERPPLVRAKPARHVHEAVDRARGRSHHLPHLGDVPDVGDDDLVVAPGRVEGLLGRRQALGVEVDRDNAGADARDGSAHRGADPAAAGPRDEHDLAGETERVVEHR
jgi:hypothetical protein